MAAPTPVPPTSAGQRVDKWLFFARIAKSRTFAARLVEEGRVRINRDKIDSPARRVRPGDVLTLNLQRDVVVVRVLDGGSRRGPAPEARQLYEPVGGGRDALAT